MDEQENRAIEEVLNRLRADFPDGPAETVGTPVQAAQAELAGHRPVSEEDVTSWPGLEPVVEPRARGHRRR